MLVIEALWEKPLAPAFVIGYEIDYKQTEDVLHELVRRTVPPWLCGVRQQFGGYSVFSHRMVIGIVLPLHANIDRALLSPEPLFQTFDWLEAIDKYSPRLEKGVKIKQPPYFSDLLLKLVYTWGEDLPQDALQFLHEILSRHFRIPRFIGGPEAFVRTDTQESLDILADWNVANFGSINDPSLAALHYLEVQDILKSYNLSYVRMTSDLLTDLASSAQEFATNSALNAFFMWTNSD